MTAGSHGGRARSLDLLLPACRGSAESWQFQVAVHGELSIGTGELRGGEIGLLKSNVESHWAVGNRVADNTYLLHSFNRSRRPARKGRRNMRQRISDGKSTSNYQAVRWVGDKGRHNKGKQKSSNGSLGSM